MDSLIADNRQRIEDLAPMPYGATCFVQLEYGANRPVGRGTGFHIGHGRIATAAHVLWADPNNAGNAVFPNRVRVFLGNGLYKEQPQLLWRLRPSDGVNIAIHEAFRAGDHNWDVGWLQLPVSPGAATSILGFPADLSVGEIVQINGFPVDRKPFGAYEGSGPLATLNLPTFLHQVPTADGQSGAPIRVQRGGSSQVIGLHLGKHDSHNNRALALTQPIVAWLHQ